MKGGMAKGMTTWILGAVVMTVRARTRCLLLRRHMEPAMGAAVGFFNWLGFILVVHLDDWAAAKRPFKLVAINAGNTLVSLLIMGAILATW
jgi:hypothetical protein